MITQAVRTLLASVSTMVVVVGLAPLPAAAADPPAPVPAAPAAPEPAPVQTITAEPQPVEPPPAAPAGSLLDVFAGLGGNELEIDPPADGETDPPAGVAQEVREAAADDGEVPVIIRLREQADLAAVEQEAALAGRAAASAAEREQGPSFAGDRERAARGEVVVDALRSVARSSQPQVRDLLQDHDAEDVQDFWIINGFAATVDEATLAALAEHPDVASVTLDESITLDEPIPTETGQPRLPSWSLESVNAPDVWGEYGVRGAGVVVGVMDTGVDGAHPALADTWRGNDGDTGASWFPATGENYPVPGDSIGHGTHVTGSIVGAPPGEVVGVAPDAQWIAAKIFRDSGSTTDSIVHAAFEWMLAPGGDPANAPDLVNNSWGSANTYRTEFWDDVAAWVAAGIVPVFANGNNGPGTETVDSPGSYPHSIGVGAIDIADRAAFFSARGPVTWDGVEYQKPQVSAPGYEVVSSLPGGGYGTASGTSMATPHVAGVVALMLSAAPGLSIAEVRETLEATARDESHTVALPNTYGAGIADAFAAVTYLTHAGTVTGTVTGPDGAPVAAEVSAGGQTATVENGQYALRLTEGTHELRIRAYGYASQTRTVTVSAGGTSVVNAELAVAPERTLTGTVTGPAGVVPDARVVVAGTPLPPARSGQDGRFRLTIAEGEYELRVSAGGFAPATVPVTVTGDGEVTATLAPVPSTPDWAQYQNNPARTGLSADSLAGETLQPAWSAPAGGPVLFSSPVMAGDRAFVNTDNGTLAALDATSGEQLWTFAGSDFMRGAPAVAGGVVYTGGGVDGGIYAVDAATGALRWHLPTPGRRAIYTAPVVREGVVYAATGFTPDRSDTLYALDAATGAVIWSVDIGPSSFFGPAVADGLVVATSDAGLVALDASTGARRWLLERPDRFIGAPSIDGGTVYVTTSLPEPNPAAPSTRGSLLAVDATSGALRWEAQTHGDGQGSSPAVYGDLVIAGSHGLGVVAAYDRATGEPAWHYGLEVTGGVSSSIMVTGDGYVVGGAQLDRRIFVLDAGTGELVWEQRLDANVVSSPAYAGGRLLVADEDGLVRAYHPTGEVRGTVTGPDGPLPATVALVGTDHRATADAAGAFTLAGVPPGEYTVEVSHFGFGAQTRSIRVFAGQAATVDASLAPVGDGALAGTVRDEAGQPLPGATVTLSPTPLAPVVTGEDGGYSFATVAEGTYQIAVDAAGYESTSEAVTIVAGQAAVADFALARFDIAVVADHEGRITATLQDAGWRVDQVSYAEIPGTLAHYQAVVLAGMTGDRADADPDRLNQLIAEADEAGTSLVFAGTGAPSYGSIRALSRITGDPALQDAELSNRGGVWLEDVVAHPITASLQGERVPLLTSGSWHEWFSGYSGYSLARLGTDRDGQLGDGIGYQRRTLDSDHILLPSIAPFPWGDWEPAAATLLVDAVGHAAAASYGALSGRVTDAEGNPVPATIEVVDGFERTTAGADGGYRLILEPGEATLRLRFLGSETVELPVTVVEGATFEVDVTLPDPAFGVVAGQVSDASRGTPVAGATVTVGGLPPVTTGADGRYVVEDVSSGEYRVEFSAEGYEPLAIDAVAVTNGEVTTLDAKLTRAPGVVVVGDRNGQVTAFLEQHSIPAEQTPGWEVLDALDGVEVVVLQNPPDIGRAEFLAALAAFDEAGVSVIFPADGWNTRTRGLDLLSRHTGNPASYSRLGGVGGPEIFLHNLADHPLFEGVGGSPVRLLTAGSEAGVFPAYTGIRLADAGAGTAAPAGIGMAYDARTPDSVHLLLSGLAATLRNTPGSSWTPDGQRIFLNAVRWAAAPGMGGFTGTVTDLNETPIPDATVEVVGTHWRAVTSDSGAFELGVPPGEYTLRYQAFGYVTAERAVTVAADQRLDVSASLTVGEVGAVSGVVTSSEGGPLSGVRVALHGTPHETLTGADGSYQFPLVESGAYELELETGGHVRTLADVSVVAGTGSRRDVVLRASPLVGIIDDSDFSNSRDRGKQFLQDWGYRVEDIGFDSLDRIPALDLVVANVSDFDLDPGPAGLAAFEEAVNRAGVPVLWMAQHGRGGIQFLNQYQHDPATVGEGFGDGTVTATAVQDHPLVAGLPQTFPLIAPEGRYTFFDQFGGTTVARLATGEGGDRGATIAYRGRTTSTVDVLLSTLSVTTWGAPSTRQSPAVGWTREAERVFVNALAWALDADGIGAEVRGTVQSSRGGRIASQVEVLETGRTYQGRTGDGSFLVPLQPGTWTLAVSAFGHEPSTMEVTVGPGEAVSREVTLAAGPAGTVTGAVTGPDGSPVAGARVGLIGTPLSTTTATDGSYTIGQVPAGEWMLRVTAGGFRAGQVPVTVTGGQATPVDVRLTTTSTIAVVDSTGSSLHGVSLAGMLSAEGYEVELVPRAQLAALAAGIADYDLVIFNAEPLTAQRAAFGQAVGAAATAGVSTVFPGQFSGGALRELSILRGDPQQVNWDFEPDGVDYVPSTAHPIFAGFPAGQPIPLISNPGQNQQWASYSGWSGETIAHVHSRAGDDLGASVGYRFSSPTSVELLLGSLTASTFGWPDERWTPQARQIYLNAVAWSLDATQAELTGVVTGAGAPLAGAKVTAGSAAAVTGPDGSYTLGLAAGTYTVEITAFGFAPATQLVTIPDSGSVRLDVDLVPLPRGSVSGAVTAIGGGPVAGATVTGAGPVAWTATTGQDGRYAAADLIEGEYEVTVTAAGFLPATATVTIAADTPATLDVALQPTDVGVLGDVDGALTSYLRGAGVPAAALEWDAGLDLRRYDVVVVNGGSPDAATFEAVLAAADEAQVSLLFTGSWAVDRGGIRLLERYTDRVEVGAQGYGDGPVQLTGFDPDHPVFARLGADPATLIVEGGYYSVLSRYAGRPLADLRVTREGAEPVAGLAVGWDWRTAGSIEVLLSASAVTEAVGPGLGWTPEGSRLVVDAIAWAREQVLAPPAAPSIAAGAPVVVTETVQVSGEAEWPWPVTVLRDGEPVATVEVGEDGSWSAEVPLAVGDNELTAVTSNPAGDSPVSLPVTVARWVPEWEVRGQRPVHPITLSLDGPLRWTDPADKAQLVVRSGDTEVLRADLQWINGFYLYVLRGLRPGSYELSAELTVGGHLLVIDGPQLN
jgi:outer membrane protein assembly factor BamB/subtilisin family serine protease